MTSNIKKNSKSFEFGDTSIRFERPIESGEMEQTAIERSNRYGLKYKPKKFNETKIPESRFAE